MVEVVWTATAIEDLNAIAEYISLDSEYYATRYVKQIWNAPLVLENQPLTGKIVPEFNQENIREIVFGKSRKIYQHHKLKVSILAVRHSARLLKRI